MKTKIIIASCIMLLTVFQVFATIKSTSKVLLLGSHSLAYKDCLQGLYQNDSDLQGIGLDISFDDHSSQNIIEDYYFSREMPTDNNDLTEVLDVGYDIILLILDPTRIKEWPELSMEAVRIISRHTRRMGSRILVPMLWDGNSAVVHTEEYEEHTYRICDALNAECVPAGLAWKEVLSDTDKNISESSTDDVASEEAEYVMAASVFNYLFEFSNTSKHLSREFPSL